MRQNPLNMTIGALLILIFGLLLFLFQVRTSEVAVVTTFGRPTRPINEPGLYAKWPWPIQKVHKLDKRVQNLETKYNQTFLSDGYTVMVNVYAGWRIADPAAFFPRFPGGSVTNAQARLDELIRDAKNAVIGRHTLGDFIATDEKNLKFAQIESEILKLVHERLQATGYGVQVDFLAIKRLGLPESVTENVFGRMRAERQVLVTRIESEGNSQAQMIRATADRDAAKLISDADAQATRIRGEGEAEAAKSFAVLNQDPELANFLQRLTGLEMFLREKTTLILDQNTSPLDLLSRPSGARSAGRPTGVATQ